MKRVGYILAMMAVAAVLTGCFKKVTTDTTFVIKPNLQIESGGEMTVAEGVTGYACYVGEEWSIASYEDAVAHILTDAEAEKSQTVEPDVVAQLYGDGTSGLLAIHAEAPHVLLVTIYEDGGMYAWRHFDSGVNVAETYLTLQFRVWKRDGYTDSGWNVGVVERPEDPQPEDPEDPEDPENPDDSEDDENVENPENPEDGGDPDAPESPDEDDDDETDNSEGE